MRDIRETLQGRRGSLLVIALMVLLALTSVALVAVQNTNSALSYAGNTRRAVSAFRVTEGGAFTAMAFAGSLGADTFTAKYDSLMAASGKAEWAPSDMVPDAPYFDLSSQGSFGYEGLVQAADAAAHGAPGATPYDVSVDITPTGMRQPLVGYSLGGKGSRCRFKYQMDANGRVGVTYTGAGTEAANEVWQRIRSLTFVGPLPCDAAAGTIGTVPGS